MARQPIRRTGCARVLESEARTSSGWAWQDVRWLRSIAERMLLQNDASNLAGKKI